MRTNVKSRSPIRRKLPKLDPTSAEAQLRRSVMNCLLWEREFYDAGENIADRIYRLVPQVHAETVGAIAVDARNVSNLRHVPLLIVDAMCKAGGWHRRLVGQVLPLVIQRPDELSEFMAIYWRNGKTPLASQVKKGLAAAFNNFSEYQLAKYNGGDREIKLRDVMFLVHPTPATIAEHEAFAKLANKGLSSPDTWEVALSGGAEKKETWERLMVEGKLGALALLRNLRNMEKAGVDRDLIRVALLSMNTERVLPFRFISAARYAPWAEPELEAAMLGSLAAAPKLMGKTALLIDASTSMSYALSEKSELNRYEAAVALAILAREVCDDVDVIRFGGTVTEVPPRRGFALRDAMGRPSGNTPMNAAHRAAIQRGYDRVIILTDGESTDGPPPPPVAGKPGYMINVASTERGVDYGDWNRIDGWSEAVISFITSLEAGE